VQTLSEATRVDEALLELREKSVQEKRRLVDQADRRIRGDLRGGSFEELPVVIEGEVLAIFLR
jgi:hypothetical protein